MLAEGRLDVYGPERRGPERSSMDLGLPVGRTLARTLGRRSEDATGDCYFRMAWVVIADRLRLAWTIRHINDVAVLLGIFLALESPSSGSPDVGFADRTDRRREHGYHPTKRLRVPRIAIGMDKPM